MVRGDLTEAERGVQANSLGVGRPGQVSERLGIASCFPGRVIRRRAKQQNGTKARTELIIFIRPTVIRDPVDARMVAEELRAKLNGEQIGGNFPGIHNGPVIHP